MCRFIPLRSIPKSQGGVFIISNLSAARGALLYNAEGERFANELMPRDLLTEAIRAQMAADGTDFVWEDLRPIGEEEIKNHFPNIYARCLEEGYDVTRECIPVTPAQHYFMGGIHVDEDKTTMEHLYAIGENRLQRCTRKKPAGQQLCWNRWCLPSGPPFTSSSITPHKMAPLPAVDFSAYEPAETLAARRKRGDFIRDQEAE